MNAVSAVTSVLNQIEGVCGCVQSVAVRQGELEIHPLITSD